MTSRLTGVAIITGASSGIGRGTAIAFTQAGCRKLLLGDINESGLEKTRSELVAQYSDVDVDVAHVDISKEDSVNAFIERGIAKFGRIDYACNVAGVCPPRTPIIDVDPEVFDRVIDTNMLGTFLCHKAEINAMLRQDPVEEHSGVRGSIVSVSSMAGINASPGVAAYSSTKFGIIGLVKTDAQDYGPHGIRINAVCPGFTMTEALLAISTAEQRSAIAATVPLKRLCQGEEVGRTMAWLCSREASYVHGAAYPTDGGALSYRQA